jgi:CheY-like chemotaxis protein
MRILLAEDEPQLRLLLIRMLSILGHRVEAVADGGELLLRAAAAEPDAVLSDIGLPGCDGIKAGLRLRKALPRLPLVLMTGDPRRAGQARRAGFATVLLKPFALEELRSVFPSV